jgi:nicotinamidase-related amidase
MKNRLVFLTTMFLLIPCFVFAQDQAGKERFLVKPALIVIDIQNAYLTGIPEADKQSGLRNINYLIDLFRSNGFPVISVYHYNPEYGIPQNSELFQFPSSIKVREDDPKIIKTYGNGFTKTDLDKIIKESGSNTLFLCGLSATGCVLATWVGAQDNDYHAFMVKDAIMSKNTDHTHEIEDIVDAVSMDVVDLIVKSAKN